MGLQGRSRKGWNFARLGACLAVCALAVRILIPAGYMPGPAQGGIGFPTLVICTAQGAKTVAIDAADQVVKDRVPFHKNGEAKNDHGCVFAGHAVPVVTELSDLADRPAGFDVVQGELKRAHQRPGLGLAAPPPPKTGPPSIV